MITKITVSFSHLHTYHKDARLPILTFQAAAKHTMDISDRLKRISQVVSYLTDNPERSVQDAIRMYFGPGASVDVKKIGKRKWRYYIPFLSIETEETVPA